MNYFPKTADISRRAVAIITLFSVILASMPPFVPAASAAPRGTAGLIPSSAGRITDARVFEGGPLAVVIQDLHCHPEVQKNISEILSSLDRACGIRNIYLEGCSGEVDTSWLNDAVRDKDIRKAVVDALMEKGELTGAEYYSHDSGRYRLIRGLENEELYDRTIRRLAKIHEYGAAAGKDIEAAGEELRRIQSTYMSRENLRFERLSRDHESGRIKAGKYYSILLKRARKAGIAVNGFSNMARYLAVAGKARSLDNGKISAEMNALLALLRARLPYREYSEIVSASNNGRSPEALSLLVERAALGQGIELGKSYPRLAAFLSYNRLAGSVDPLRLVDEESRLLLLLQEKLSGSASEKEVVFLGKAFKRYCSFITGSVSYEDYRLFKKENERFYRLWNLYSGEEYLAPLEVYRALLEEYHQGNIERNEWFAKNSFGDAAPAARAGAGVRVRPDEAQRLLSRSDNMNVTVAGGFHTRGYTELLAARGISYVVITPNVTGDTVLSDSVYRRRVREQALSWIKDDASGVSRARRPESPPDGSGRGAGNFAAAVRALSADPADIRQAAVISTEIQLLEGRGWTPARIEKEINGLAGGVPFAISGESFFIGENRYKIETGSNDEETVVPVPVSGPGPITLARGAWLSLRPDLLETIQGAAAPLGEDLLEFFETWTMEYFAEGLIQRSLKNGVESLHGERFRKYEVAVRILPQKHGERYLVDTEEWLLGTVSVDENAGEIVFYLSAPFFESLYRLDQDVRDRMLNLLIDHELIPYRIMSGGEEPESFPEEALKIETDAQFHDYITRCAERPLHELGGFERRVAAQRELLDYASAAARLSGTMRQGSLQKKVTDSFLSYMDAEYAVRVSENTAFRMIRDALAAKDERLFEDLFIMLVSAVGRYPEALEMPDITVLLHEIYGLEPEGDGSRAMLRYLDGLSRHPDKTVAAMAAKARASVKQGVLVFLSPEAVPVSKAGGMGSAVGERAQELAATGLKVYVITPLYQKNKQALLRSGLRNRYREPLRNIRVSKDAVSDAGLSTARVNGVEYILLENLHFAEELYGPGVSQTHEMMRSVFLCNAAVEAVRRLHVKPSMFIGNDWMTAPARLRFKKRLAENPEAFGYLADMLFPCILHNGGSSYQFRVPRWVDGRDRFQDLGVSSEEESLFVDENDHSLINFTQALLRSSDMVFEVSEGQLKEHLTTEGSAGLLNTYLELRRGGRHFSSPSGIEQGKMQIKLFGSSAHEALRAGREAVERWFGRVLEGKAEAKTRELGKIQGLWGQEPPSIGRDTLVVGMVMRIEYQKNMELVERFIESIVNDEKYKRRDGGENEKVVFVMSGVSADKRLMDRLNALKGKYPGRVGYFYGFIPEEDKETLMKASDVFIEFSNFEPQGLSPLEALSAGCVVLLSRVGGHISTCRHGMNGRLFSLGERALENALNEFGVLYDMKINDKRGWRRMVFRGAAGDHGWDVPIRSFLSQLDELSEMGPRSGGAARKPVPARFEAPSWVKGMRVYDMNNSRAPEAQGPRSDPVKFSGLEKLIETVKGRKYNALRLTPLREPDRGPYSPLSSCAIDPGHIDWEAEGLEGKKPEEKWKVFADRLPEEFFDIMDDERVLRYAHVKACHEAGITDPDGTFDPGNLEGFAAKIFGIAGGARYAFDLPGEYWASCRKILMEQHFARAQLAEALERAEKLGIKVICQPGLAVPGAGSDGDVNPGRGAPSLKETLRQYEFWMDLGFDAVECGSIHAAPDDFQDELIRLAAKRGIALLAKTGGDENDTILREKGYEIYGAEAPGAPGRPPETNPIAMGIRAFEVIRRLYYDPLTIGLSEFLMGRPSNALAIALKGLPWQEPLLSFASADDRDDVFFDLREAYLSRAGSREYKSLELPGKVKFFTVRDKYVMADDRCLLATLGFNSDEAFFTVSDALRDRLYAIKSGLEALPGEFESYGQLINAIVEHELDEHLALRSHLPAFDTYLWEKHALPLNRAKRAMRTAEAFHQWINSSKCHSGVYPRCEEQRKLLAYTETFIASVNETGLDRVRRHFGNLEPGMVRYVYADMDGTLVLNGDAEVSLYMVKRIKRFLEKQRFFSIVSSSGFEDVQRKLLDRIVWEIGTRGLDRDLMEKIFIERNKNNMKRNLFDTAMKGIIERFTDVEHRMLERLPVAANNGGQIWRWDRSSGAYKCVRIDRMESGDVERVNGKLQEVLKSDEIRESFKRFSGLEEPQFFDEEFFNEVIGYRKTEEGINEIDIYFLGKNVSTEDKHRFADDCEKNGDPRQIVAGKLNIWFKEKGIPFKAVVGGKTRILIIKEKTNKANAVNWLAQAVGAEQRGKDGTRWYSVFFGDKFKFIVSSGNIDHDNRDSSLLWYPTVDVIINVGKDNLPKYPISPTPYFYVPGGPLATSRCMKLLSGKVPVEGMPQTPEKWLLSVCPQLHGGTVVHYFEEKDTEGIELAARMNGFGARSVIFLPYGQIPDAYRGDFKTFGKKAVLVSSGKMEPVYYGKINAGDAGEVLAVAVRGMQAEDAFSVARCLADQASGESSIADEFREWLEDDPASVFGKSPVIFDLRCFKVPKVLAGPGFSFRGSDMAAAAGIVVRMPVIPDGGTPDISESPFNLQCIVEQPPTVREWVSPVREVVEQYARLLFSGQVSFIPPGSQVAVAVPVRKIETGSSSSQVSSVYQLAGAPGYHEEVSVVILQGLFSPEDPFSADPALLDPFPDESAGAALFPDGRQKSLENAIKRFVALMEQGMKPPLRTSYKAQLWRSGYCNMLARNYGHLTGRYTPRVVFDAIQSYLDREIEQTVRKFHGDGKKVHFWVECADREQARDCAEAVGMWLDLGFDGVFIDVREASAVPELLPLVKEAASSRSVPGRAIEVTVSVPRECGLSSSEIFDKYGFRSARELSSLGQNERPAPFEAVLQPVGSGPEVAGLGPARGAGMVCLLPWGSESGPIDPADASWVSFIEAVEGLRGLVRESPEEAYQREYDKARAMMKSFERVSKEGGRRHASRYLHAALELYDSDPTKYLGNWAEQLIKEAADSSDEPGPMLESLRRRTEEYAKKFKAARGNDERLMVNSGYAGFIRGVFESLALDGTMSPEKRALEALAFFYGKNTMPRTVLRSFMKERRESLITKENAGAETPAQLNSIVYVLQRIAQLEGTDGPLMRDALKSEEDVRREIRGLIMPFIGQCCRRGIIPREIEGQIERLDKGRAAGDRCLTDTRFVVNEMIRIYETWVEDDGSFRGVVRRLGGELPGYVKALLQAA